jgi:hypothetical protein
MGASAAAWPCVNRSNVFPRKRPPGAVHSRDRRAATAAMRRRQSRGKGSRSVGLLLLLLLLLRLWPVDDGWLVDDDDDGVHRLR